MTPSPYRSRMPQQQGQQSPQQGQPQQRQQRNYYGAPQQHPQAPQGGASPFGGVTATNTLSRSPAPQGNLFAELGQKPPQTPAPAPAQPVNAWGAANDAWKAQQSGAPATPAPSTAPAPAPAPSMQAQPASYLDAPAANPANGSMGSTLGTLGGLATANPIKTNDGGALSRGVHEWQSADTPQNQASDGGWGGSGGGDAMPQAPLDAPAPVEAGGMGGPQHQQQRRGMGGGMGRRNYYGQ